MRWEKKIVDKHSLVFSRLDDPICVGKRWNNPKIRNFSKDPLCDRENWLRENRHLENRRDQTDDDEMIRSEMEGVPSRLVDDLRYRWKEKKNGKKAENEN